MLGAFGAHFWSPWQDQEIIDTPHYRLVSDGLQYVAWRNNTFSNHVHVGVRGADRAVAVCDALRPVLPVLLAASANSAFVEGVFSGLHSARTQIFTKSFPRCGVPDHYGSWDEYARYIAFLYETNSITENTQIWWSVRPHFSFGTVEVRIMDAQISRRRVDRRCSPSQRPASRRRRSTSTRTGRLPARMPAAPDRGEHLAGDPPRARRQADRPRGRPRGGGARGCRAARSSGPSRRARALELDEHLGGALADARLRQRRAAPVARPRGRQAHSVRSCPATVAETCSSYAEVDERRRRLLGGCRMSVEGSGGAAAANPIRSARRSCAARTRRGAEEGSRYETCCCRTSSR